jgi:hypothetical protein
MQGGKRKGAGRPPAPKELKKRMISVRLPNWLLDWMNQQQKTNRAKLIENALKKMYNINQPSENND